ncbi:MAG: hypothetical protein WC069_00130 [Candidatus Shapirobacteria bacterium]
MNTKVSSELVLNECYTFFVPYYPEKVLVGGRWKNNNDLAPGRSTLYKIDGLTQCFVVDSTGGDTSDLKCRTFGKDPVRFKLPKDSGLSVVVITEAEAVLMQNYY